LTQSLRAAAAAPICLLLSVRAATTMKVRWVKTGAGDSTVSRVLQDCNAQANAALATERGINQDINATLGGNWQFSGTAQIEQQMLNFVSPGRRQLQSNTAIKPKSMCDCMWQWKRLRPG
jgi:hypothetical protein